MLFYFYILRNGHSCESHSDEKLCSLLCNNTYTEVVVSSASRDEILMLRAADDPSESLKIYETNIKN